MKESERRHRERAVKPIAELVEHVLEGYHVAEDVRRHRVATEWPRIVGARIASRAVPGRLYDGILEIRVSSSAWLHELSFLSDDIIARINTALGDPPVVHEVRWHLAAHANPSASPRHRQAARKGETVRERPAAPERADAIQRESQCVDDEELRELIADVRRRYDL